jgi:hypothetical protein
MNINTGAGIGVIAGVIIGATSGEWWWIGITIGIGAGMGVVLGNGGKKKQKKGEQSTDTPDD